MTEAFKQFFKSIKPTNKGTLAVILVIILIPILADVFLVFISIRNRDLMLVTPFIFMGCIKYFPLLLLYLLIYFFIDYWYKKIFNNKE
jgi:sterol desaturase/sphingolipid hydroxylase (fatty acid hydroxylase superfamily)